MTRQRPAYLCGRRRATRGFVVAQFAHGGGGAAFHGPRMKGAAVLYLKEAGSLSIDEASGAVSARLSGETVSSHDGS